MIIDDGFEVPGGQEASTRLIARQLSQEYFNSYFDEVRSLVELTVDLKARVIVDIGAHIGVHTVNYAINNPAAVVYAIEPSLPNIDLLKKNIVKFGISNVKVFNVAVSDEPGVVTVYNNGDNSGDTRIYQSDDYFPVSTNDAVAQPLDSIMDGVDRIDYIKMDTQGSEFEVFTGGKDCIIKHRPVIFMEFWPRGLWLRGASMEAFLDVLDACDYKIKCYHHRGSGIEDVDKQWVIKHYIDKREVDEYINLLLY